MRKFVVRRMRRIMLWLMRWYLKRAAGATRNGSTDGGYIVAMTADQYHRYVLSARDEPEMSSSKNWLSPAELERYQDQCLRDDMTTQAAYLNK